MTIFVISYHRRTGAKSIAEFSDDQDEAAFTRRRELERTVDDGTEVVILRGKDRNQLERTHARYFRSPSELGENLRAALE